MGVPQKKRNAKKKSQPQSVAMSARHLINETIMSGQYIHAESQRQREKLESNMAAIAIIAPRRCPRRRNAQVTCYAIYSIGCHCS